MVRVAWEERCSARPFRAATSDADRVSRGTRKDGRETFPSLLGGRHPSLGHRLGLSRGAGGAEQHSDRQHSTIILPTTGSRGSGCCWDSCLSGTSRRKRLTGKELLVQHCSVVKCEGVFCLDIP